MELFAGKIHRPTLFKIIQYIVLEWPLLQNITKIFLCERKGGLSLCKLIYSFFLNPLPNDLKPNSENYTKITQKLPLHYPCDLSPEAFSIKGSELWSNDDVIKYNPGQ